MSFASNLYFLTLILVGVPAAFRLDGRVRNPVALAMVATWLVCRVLYWITGEHMPLQGMVMSDMVVIAAMFVKDDWCQCRYRGNRHQLACVLWLERTPWDRLILCLFPAVWLFYAPIVGPDPQFWTLWTLSMAQLALAGFEGLHQWRGLRANVSRAADERPPGLGFTAWERGYG